MINIKLLPTRSEVEKYLNSLECPDALIDIYRTLDAIRFSEDDTLSDEFQMSSDMLDIIYKYTAKHLDITRDFFPGDV